MAAVAVCLSPPLPSPRFAGRAALVCVSRRRPKRLRPLTRRRRGCVYRCIYFLVRESLTSYFCFGFRFRPEAKELLQKWREENTRNPQKVRDLWTALELNKYLGDDSEWRRQDMAERLPVSTSS